MLPSHAPSDYLTAHLRPCWHCRWSGGLLYQIHWKCLRPGGIPVVATPKTGCAFYEREPGADDDGWAPALACPQQRRGRVFT